jgi:Helicase associated domain
MFEMPFVPNVQLAQQGLHHGSLRFKSQRSVPSTMAFTPSLGNRQFHRPGMPQPNGLLAEYFGAITAFSSDRGRSNLASRRYRMKPKGLTLRQNQSRRILREGRNPGGEKLESVEASGPDTDVVPRRNWDEQLANYVRFVREHNRVPSQYGEHPDERMLTFWLRHQKASLRNGLLLPGKLEKLERVLPGWSSPNRLRPSWNQTLARVVQFKTAYGRWPSNASSDHAERSLANWLYRQAAARTESRDRQHAERIAKLNNALPGWRRRRRPSGDTERWNSRLEHVLEHVRTYGRLPTTRSTTSPEEYALGKWLSVQRYALKKGTLYPERLARLDELLPGWRPAAAP